MSLPQFILLKSNESNKFLCYGKKKEKGKSHASSLTFSHEMSTPSQTESETKTDLHLIKFQVEEAQTAEGLVHIRTCYNNKYWVRKDGDDKTIVAEAHEAEEDQSKRNCTLFKPILLGTADDESYSAHNLVPPTSGEKPLKIQLVHVSEQEQHYLDGTLERRSSASGGFTAFSVVETVSLPSLMTFIGSDNRYLSNFEYNNLGFVTTDMGASGVAMYQPLSPRMGANGVAMDMPPIGYITLAVRENSKKWYLNPNNDIGLSNSGYSNTTFGPIRVGDSIALHVEANNCFITRANNGSYDGTSAHSATITEAAKFRVGEPVISREVLSADYDLENARVYNTSSVDKYVDSRANDTELEQTGVFEVEYKSTQTMSWNQSLEVHVGVAVSWSVGIPYVGDLGLDISYDRTQTAAWGEEKAEEKTVKYTQNIALPPRKKVTLKVVAVKSMCDVPFSCVVRDVMTDGNTYQYTKNDGLYKGANEFQFQTVIKEEDV